MNDENEEYIISNIIEYIIDTIVDKENSFTNSTTDNYENNLSEPGTSGYDGGCLDKNKYTVKEILTEILECPILLKPSYHKNNNEESIEVPSSSGEITQDTRCKLQYSTMKDILNDVLHCPVYFRNSENRPSINNPEEPSTSQCDDYAGSMPELRIKQTIIPLYNCFDTRGQSLSAIQCEDDTKQSAILPTYSTVLKLGPRSLSTQSSSQYFISKIPPPSYAEVQGQWDDLPSLISSDSVILGPDPVYIVCPRCRRITITHIWRERSKLTHIIALVLCLFMCWPCCLLPYCMGSFNYTYHRCSNCWYYLGMYRPF